MTHTTQTIKPRVLCNAVDFGFGPAGKLSAILAELPEVEPVLLRSQSFGDIVPTFARSKGEDATSLIECTTDVDAALVVLDPALASELARLGINVVYVDSLPHMWTEQDFICEDVFAYCAQRVEGIHELPRLAEVANLQWVDAISVVNGPRDPVPGSALVNVGGVSSPYGSSETSAYTELVLPPVVAALRENGYEVHVTGRVPKTLSRRLDVPDTTVVSHREFLDLLRKAAVLVTSPGMTAMLEAGSIGIPTTLLPPQNLSQVLNVEQVTRFGRGSVMSWPPNTIDRNQLELFRQLGEGPSVEYIHSAIESLRGNASAETHLRKSASTAAASADTWLADYTSALGTSGATQIAAHVRRAIYAPSQRS